MGKIFKGQSSLRIILQTFCNLEGIISAIIKYRKPDNTFGEMNAAVSDETKGIIFHEVVEGELDVSGWWVFWAYVTFADGRTAVGEMAKVFVYNEGFG